MKPAIVSAVVILLSPVWLITSTGIRQEPLFYASLMLGITLLNSTNRWIILLGIAMNWIATMTRYEAWFLCPILIVMLNKKNFTHKILITALTLLPPVLWVAWWGGISPIGTNSLQLSLSVSTILERMREHFSGIPYWIGSGVFIFGAIGVIIGCSNKGAVGNFGRTAIVFYLSMLFLIVILRPFSPPGNFRQHHITVLSISFGFGLLTKQSGSLRIISMIALLVSIPPFLRDIKDVKEWEGMKVSEWVVYISLQAKPMIEDGDRILVVSEGMREYPQYPDNDCLIFISWLQHERARISCDNEIVLNRFSENNFDWVIWIGNFTPWRPIQSRIYEIAKDDNLIVSSRDFMIIRIK